MAKLSRIPSRRRAHEIAADACFQGYETSQLCELINALYERLEFLQKEYERCLGRKLAGAVVVLAEHDDGT